MSLDVPEDELFDVESDIDGIIPEREGVPRKSNDNWTQILTRKRLITGIASVSTVACVFLLGIFAIFLFSSEGEQPADHPFKGDLSEEQKTTAEFWQSSVIPPFIASMNLSADPCNDFYNYACGGWIANTTIPSDRSSYFKSFSVIQDENDLIIKDILTAQWPLIQTLYDSCMNTNTIETLGFAPVRDFFAVNFEQRSFLPINDSSSLLLNSIASFQQIGMEVLFSIDVSPDPINPTFNILSLDQGGFGLPTRDYYFNTDDNSIAIQVAYKTYIRNMFVLVDLPQIAGKEDQMAERAYQLELQLANYSLSPQDRRDPYNLYHMYSLEEIANFTPINFTVYFSLLGVPVDVTKINIAVPKFFSALSHLLREKTEEDFFAYFLWRTIFQTVPLLPQRALDESQAYFAVLTGRKTAPERWKFCSSLTQSVLGQLVGHYFVDKHFQGESKEKAEFILEGIKTSFSLQLPTLTWMDQETVIVAEGKLNSFTDKIGYPESWNLYPGLTVYKDRFFLSMIVGWGREFRFVLEQAGQAVDKSVWYMDPQTVNAYYNPLFNEMVFPAAILQPPFYHARYPDALNYGGIGSVMGHELTHGFDDEGRLFDAQGRLHPWWTNASAEAFDELTQCPINTYSDFPLDYPGHINGEQTLGENIADMGGVKNAYFAFKAKYEQHRTDPMYQLAEEMFGMSNDKLFFVSYGQVWCGVMTEASAIMRLSTDVHSPSKARVNVPLSNFETFSQAFDCPANSPMNPETKCSIW